MKLIDRIIDVLAKIQFDEAIQLRHELEAAKALNPHAEPILQLRLLTLKNATKNSAEAVKALTHLGLVEDAMELHAMLTKEQVQVSDEVNKA